MSKAANDLAIRGKPISQDADGYFCLNDIWLVSGESKNKAPRQWRILPTTRELAEALNHNVGFSHVIAKTQAKSAIYAKTGKGGGTFAHIILALAYAEYLSPDLGIEVREIALRVWAGDASVLDEFKKTKRQQAEQEEKNLRPQAEEDETRVILRDETRAHNYVLNMILKKIGAKYPAHYGSFHDEGYRALYNGEGENDIHARKKLKRHQAILDYMSSAEAAANWFRTTQTEQHLSRYPVDSLTKACLAHRKISEIIRNAMKEMGNLMPEDMPNVDSISEAKKRIKVYNKIKNTK